MIEGFGRMGPGADIRDNQEIILRDMESVIAMVKSGRGVACLPVIDDLSVAGLKIHPYPGQYKTGKWIWTGACIDAGLEQRLGLPGIADSQGGGKSSVCNG